jgi:hypothetical protein
VSAKTELRLLSSSTWHGSMPGMHIILGRMSNHSLCDLGLTLLSIERTDILVGVYTNPSRYDRPERSRPVR